jgi:Linear amide C-N hydrolases, choloylglycine hydrolase family
VQLDQPPQQRWTRVGEDYGPQCRDAVLIIQQFLGITDEELALADLAGDALVRLFPAEYADELRGMSTASDVPLGVLVMANLYYELSAGCTSIVAQTTSGTMLHGRNLDFGAGDQFTEVLRNITIDVDFYQRDALAYRGTTFACYIGLLTGMRPGHFAVSVDEHHDRDKHGNLLEVLKYRDAAVVGLLIRYGGDVVFVIVCVCVCVCVCLFFR